MSKFINPKRPPPFSIEWYRMEHQRLFAEIYKLKDENKRLVKDNQIKFQKLSDALKRIDKMELLFLQGLGC